MRVLRAADRKASPWKNGGGVTWEVAVSPEGAAFDTFDWRISIAEVATGGPFSTFPDVDRILTIVSGEGLTLDVEGQAPTELGPASPPLAFRGDAPCIATLVDGPIRDFNVMTRRGRCSAHVHRVTAPAIIDGVADTTVLLALSGAQVGEHELGPEDAVIAGRGVTLDLERGSFLVAEIVPAS